MKLTSVILCILLCSMYSFGQDNLVKDSEVMIKAIAENDYAKIVDNTYEPIIEIGGGKNLFVRNAKMNSDGNIASGINILEANLAANSPIISTKGQLQSIVSYEVITEITDSKFKGVQYLLAISSNMGQNWKFVDLRTQDERSIKNFVPTFSTQLPYPENEGSLMIQE